MTRSVFSQSWHNVAELRPRLLPHARIFRQHYRGQLWYLIQDQTTGRHHRLSPSAHTFVTLMDGRRTVQELWNEVCTGRPEDLPTQNDIVELLSQLHAQDLLSSSVTADAAEVFERFRKQRRSRWKQRLGNPMSLRLPLIDPDKYLQRWSRYTTWLFSWKGVALWLAVVLPALAIVVQRWSELTTNMSDRILSGDNLLLIGLLFVPVKILHELGHGIATRHWGGAVPEMGVMFLVFAPVPYVDSSSSAAFRSKYQRALVGAAGMIVETFLAGIAAFIWAFAEPGLLRAVAYNVMLIAGASTLLVNGNPLLRFDGYYILSDLIEIPNLAQRGQKYWTYLSDRYLFRAHTAERPDETPAECRWLVPYTPLSWIYRIAISISIILFVASEFFIFGVLMATWTAITLIVMPLYKALKHVYTSPTLHRQRSWALKVTAAGVALVVLFVGFVPLPLRTQSEGVVWLPEQALLRAGGDGFFDHWLVEPGAKVTAGTLVALLRDPELEAELAAARGSVRELQAEYDAVQFDAPAQAEVIRQRLIQAQRKADRLQTRFAQLVVTAASDGMLAAPQHQDMIGTHYRRGTLLGYVLHDASLIARIVVTQDDVDLVRSRLADVDLRFAASVEQRISMRKLREMPGGVDELPSAALSPAGGGRIAVDPQDQNGLKTLEKMFIFDLELPPDTALGFFGSRVYVRFSHVHEPLARQWYRRFRQVFLRHFDV
jgi:putative peptide zinc metalloprotease protein